MAQAWGAPAHESGCQVQPMIRSQKPRGPGSVIVANEGRKGHERPYVFALVTVVTQTRSHVSNEDMGVLWRSSNRVQNAWMQC